MPSSLLPMDWAMGGMKAQVKSGRDNVAELTSRAVSWCGHWTPYITGLRAKDWQLQPLEGYSTPISAVMLTLSKIFPRAERKLHTHSFLHREIANNFGISSKEHFYWA